MSELTRDPVCGMDIGIQNAVVSVVSEERRFYCLLPPVPRGLPGHPASLRRVGREPDPLSPGSGRERAVRLRALPLRLLRT